MYSTNLPTYFLRGYSIIKLTIEKMDRYEVSGLAESSANISFTKVSKEI
jgi:hypothetical protein